MLIGRKSSKDDSNNQTLGKMKDFFFLLFARLRLILVLLESFSLSIENVNK